MTYTRKLSFSLSIVSHGQWHFVANLLKDLVSVNVCDLEVLLTLNIPEAHHLNFFDYPFPIRLIQNQVPKGFGANHNQAFQYANGQYFCVMNPDIRLSRNPFPQLISCFSDSSFGVVAPVVRGVDGCMEDSARRFPSPLKILCKVFGKCRGSDYLVAEVPIFPDWVGGMCMVFPSTVFKNIGGFDQRYFLYYEDVDLCGRLMLSGYKSVVCPQATVVHHAQRSSHRSLKYLRWHLASMMRFFLSSVYWRLQWHKLFGRA